VFIMITTHLQ